MSADPRAPAPWRSGSSCHHILETPQSAAGITPNIERRFPALQLVSVGAMGLGKEGRVGGSRWKARRNWTAAEQTLVREFQFHTSSARGPCQPQPSCTWWGAQSDSLTGLVEHQVR